MDYGTQVLRFRSSIPVLSPASECKSRNSGPHSSTADTDGDSFLPHKRAKLTHFPDETRMIPETIHAPGKGPVPIVQEAGWTLRAGLDGCGKYRLYRQSIPGLSNP